jgi:hypothetical protein
MVGRNWLRWALVVVVLLGGTGGCSNGRKAPESGIAKEDPVHSRPIEEVLQAHTAHLMSIEGVVGTGLGAVEGEPCILVLVSEETPALKAAIPASIEGYPVRIQEVGDVKPLEEKP